MAFRRLLSSRRDAVDDGLLSLPMYPDLTADDVIGAVAHLRAFLDS